MTSDTKPAEDAKALKPLRNTHPLAILAAAGELWLLVQLVHLSTGLLRAGAIVMILWTTFVLCMGPSLRRKALRRYMIAIRAVQRIKAMRGNTPNAEDVFDASPTMDRVAFWQGHAFAMQRVETPIERAETDVDSA